MARELRDAFLAQGEARTALDRLFAGAACVTTGQQPGLFTGPLYTIYKALSAAALARRLSDRTGRPVTPVFWVAGDDHDYAEAAHCHVPGLNNEVKTLALPPRPPDAPLTPLYREPLGEAVRPLLAALREETNPSEFRDEALAWVDRHYRPESTQAQAFAEALAELLGRFGIVVFQPTHPAVRRAMAPLLVRALEQAGDLERDLVAVAERLTQAQQPVPVTVGDGATLVMLEGPAGRDRLVHDDGAFHARRSGRRLTLADLRGLAREEPGRLSPNVLLRPVVEAALFPTLAYVAGPGELAYRPQCEPVYARLGVTPQPFVPRWSGLVVEPRVARVLDKYDLTPDDLRLPDGRLEQRLVRGGIPPEAVRALDAIRQTFPEQYDALRDAAAQVDPTLRKPVEAARNAADSALRDLEKRLVSHLKQQNEILIQQVAKARNSLVPLGRPQERVFTVAPFLCRYGPTFLDRVFAAIVQWGDALEPARSRT
jgi:bacillithiol biosynthesis cysteine-adding enzyme BshC